jgi:hypothetical protein
VKDESGGHINSLKKWIFDIQKQIILLSDANNENEWIIKLPITNLFECVYGLNMFDTKNKEIIKLDATIEKIYQELFDFRGKIDSNLFSMGNRFILSYLSIKTNIYLDYLTQTEDLIKGVEVSQLFFIKSSRYFALNTFLCLADTRNYAAFIQSTIDHPDSENYIRHYDYGTRIPKGWINPNIQAMRNYIVKPKVLDILKQNHLDSMIKNVEKRFKLGDLLYKEQLKRLKNK